MKTLILVVAFAGVAAADHLPATDLFSNWRYAELDCRDMINPRVMAAGLYFCTPTKAAPAPAPPTLSFTAPKACEPVPAPGMWATIRGWLRSWAGTSVYDCK